MDEKEEIGKEINRLCLEMSNKGLKTVILFGSRAKGNYTEESDVDICVIADALPEDMLKRRYPAPSGYKFLSIFAFYPAEFLQMLKEANPFLLDIISYGKVVYDHGFFEEAQKAFHEVSKEYGLERQEKGWSYSSSRREQRKLK
jgi:hypothetical protein